MSMHEPEQKAWPVGHDGPASTAESAASDAGPESFATSPSAAASWPGFVVASVLESLEPSPPLDAPSCAEPLSPPSLSSPKSPRIALQPASKLARIDMPAKAETTRFGSERKRAVRMAGYHCNRSNRHVDRRSKRPRPSYRNRPRICHAKSCSPLRCHTISTATTRPTRIETGELTRIPKSHHGKLQRSSGVRTASGVMAASN